ncbi:Nin one binding Zn-ribbon like protein [Teladorsagia circumcincta]|uniref:Nin one binding Zn-ribbon like protein n=1 Tax=Teladorsagia circumcincta TaxID=45464 RepID=A0A2G9U5I8_TELCI|nr:Nin one binding Zn-ribbon like protein [Teladorsagia circumcincta]
MTESSKETSKKQEKPVKHLVLDTGAIIANVNLHEIAENYYAPPEVVDELRSRRSKMTFDMLPFEVLIREPSAIALRKVVDASKKSGDFVSLSLADIKVIALTYDIHSEHCRKANAAPENEASMADVLNEIHAGTAGKTSSSTDADHAVISEPPVNTLPEGFCESVCSDDEDGWITEDNLSKALRKMGALEVCFGLYERLREGQSAKMSALWKVSIGPYTFDENIAPCAVSYKVIDVEFVFVRPTYMVSVNRSRVAVSVDENGEQVLHINWQRLANKRGLKHSLPAPKGGKHAVVEKLFEDQPIPQNRMAKVRSDPLEDGPFSVHDVTSRSAMLGVRTMNNKHRQRRNPNEARAGGRRK